ncbi:WD40-repeat-containing domain protein [Globomyces pollinis-pini]|nr:WD40-repeat-containing domain protein [Globomyces pollinis-pini]
MAILLDDIRPFWEHSVRGTRECRFSHGGHYFASISNLNVLVCDTWSFEIVATLKIASTRIRSIGWSEDDTKILTYCTDGSIQHWNIFTMKKEMEITIPGQLVTATFNNSATSTYVYVKDVGVKEIVKGFITREFVPKAPLSHIHITTGGQMMFMVTNFGSVKSVKYPFEPNTDVNDKECIEYIHHAAPITQIRTTFNERFLFTAGEDGCIWIYRIQDKEGTLVKREKDWSYSDEILVTKSDLRENYRLMNELKQRVDDIKLDSDTQLKLKDSIHTSKINDLVQKFSEEIYLLKKLIEKLHNERNSMNQKNSEELVAIKEANIEKIQEMKESFYQKLESEELRFSVLFARKSTLETQWARQINNIKENHKTRTDEITSYYKRKIEEKSVQIQRLIKELGQISVRFKGSIEEIEQDIENEVLEITYHFETKLKEESSMLKKIQEENRIMKQTYDALIQQVEEHKKEYANTVTDGKKLMLNIRSLENDILGLTNEVILK